MYRSFYTEGTFSNLKLSPLNSWVWRLSVIITVGPGRTNIENLLSILSTLVYFALSLRHLFLTDYFGFAARYLIKSGRNSQSHPKLPCPNSLVFPKLLFKSPPV